MVSLNCLQTFLSFQHPLPRVTEHPTFQIPVPISIQLLIISVLHYWGPFSSLAFPIILLLHHVFLNDHLPMSSIYSLGFVAIPISRSTFWPAPIVKHHIKEEIGRST